MLSFTGGLSLSWGAVSLEPEVARGMSRLTGPSLDDHDDDEHEGRGRSGWSSRAQKNQDESQGPSPRSWLL